MVLATGAIAAISVGGGFVVIGISAGIGWVAGFFRRRPAQPPEAVPLDHPIASAEVAPEGQPPDEGRREEVVAQGESFEADLNSQNPLLSQQQRQSYSDNGSLSSLSDGVEAASVASVFFKATDQHIIAEKLKRRIDRLYCSKKILVLVDHQHRTFSIETYRDYAAENQALISTCRRLFQPAEVLVNTHPDSVRQSHVIDLPWSVLSHQHVQKIRRTYAKKLYPDDRRGA